MCSLTELGVRVSAHFRCAGWMDLSAALWSELPLEVLDQVLSFLSVPDLCRYRTVCKRWDQLMCNPKFGSLCARNAAKRDSSFIAMRYSSCGRRHEGWCFLDLSARRWYVFKDDDQEIRQSFYRGVVRMDGGLACHFLEPEGHRMVVYNPIARKHTELPTVPSNSLTLKFYPELTMVVDTVSQSFKIFLLHSFDTEFLDDRSTPLESLLNEPLMLVYESVTNEWRALTSPFRIRPGKAKGSSVMFQGCLYVYLYSSLREEHPLWRYNLVEGSWENLAVPIGDEFPISELIVSANRLFLVAWATGGSLEYDDDRPWSFQVIELRVADKTREVVFDISKADIVGGFDLKTGIENPLSNIPSICVIGFGNSLLFMSKSTGVSAAFDLVTRTWDRGLPPNPLDYLPDERCLWFGKQMNLSLPCTLW